MITIYQSESPYGGINPLQFWWHKPARPGDGYFRASHRERSGAASENSPKSFFGQDESKWFISGFWGTLCFCNDSSVDCQVPYVFLREKNLPCLVDWDQPMKPCRRGGFSRDRCYGSHRWNSRWNGCWPVQLQLMSESTSNNKAGKIAIMMYWHAEVGNLQQLNSLTAWCFLYLDLRFLTSCSETRCFCAPEAAAFSRCLQTLRFGPWEIHYGRSKKRSQLSFEEFGSQFRGCQWQSLD